MLIALVLALGAIPQAVRADIGEGDYPEAALRRAATGLTRAEVVVSPEGSVLRCDLVGSSGARDLDARSCSLTLHRFRFSPAHDEAGVPIAGVKRVDVTWAINRPYRYAAWIDLTLTVDRLPPELTAPRTTVRIVLDPAARVETCTVQDGSGAPALDRLACASLAKTTLLPIRDAAGTPIRAIRELTIAFSAGAPRR